MKVLILVPIWRRPAITKIWAEAMSYYLTDNVTVLTIISYDDPDYAANLLIIAKNKFERCFYKNEPLGEKLNAGIEYALQNYEFDYLMNLGSDDILHPAIWGLYKNFMDDRIPFFGLDKVYFYDTLQNKLALSKPNIWGAGRMILREILNKIKKKGEFLYKNDFNSGLDTNSLENIKFNLDIDYIQLETHDFPYLVDVKSDIGIGEFLIMVNHYDLVDSGILKDYFPEKLLTWIK